MGNAKVEILWDFTFLQKIYGMPVIVIPIVGVLGVANQLEGKTKLLDIIREESEKMQMAALVGSPQILRGGLKNKC